MRGRLTALALLAALPAAGPVPARAAEAVIDCLEVATRAPNNPVVPVWYRVPRGYDPSRRARWRVLVLFGGRNADGRPEVSGKLGWTAWADLNGVFLVAPTLRDDAYWEPEAWSGRALLDALAALAAKYRVAQAGLLFYGYSAGSQAANLFPAWRPWLCRAYVSHACGVFHGPSPKMRGVAGLVTCGDADAARYALGRRFVAACRARGVPVVWRSFPNRPHDVPEASARLARGSRRPPPAARPSRPRPRPSSATTRTASTSRRARRRPPPSCPRTASICRRRRSPPRGGRPAAPPAGGAANPAPRPGRSGASRSSSPSRTACAPTRASSSSSAGAAGRARGPSATSASRTGRRRAAGASSRRRSGTGRGGVYPEAFRADAPALVSCGVGDAGRFGLSRTFACRYREAGGLLVWKPTRGGHGPDAGALALARALFAAVASGAPCALWGEDDTRRVLPRARIDPEYANPLYTPAMAALWRGE